MALQRPQTAPVEDQVSKHRRLVRTSRSQTLYYPKRNLTSKESQSCYLGLWARAYHSLASRLVSEEGVQRIPRAPTQIFPVLFGHRANCQPLCQQSRHGLLTNNPELSSGKSSVARVQSLQDG